MEFRDVSAEGHAGELVSVAEAGMQGLLYQDGSSVPHVLAELARASWAVVQVDDAGRPVAQVNGVVPSYLPQTAPVAEWCSYSAVTDFAVGDTFAHQDRKAVVDELSKPLKLQLTKNP